MSLSADELKRLQIANPDMVDTTDTKLEAILKSELEKAQEEQDAYLKRMQDLGFRDEYGRWTDKGIRECIK